MTGATFRGRQAMAVILEGVLTAIGLAIIGFPFIVGFKNPHKFEPLYEIYAKIAFSLWAVFFVGHAGFQIGKMHTLQGIADGNGLTKQQAVELAAAFSFSATYAWASMFVVGAYIGALMFFRKYYAS